MADNYLENRMEEHQRRQDSAAGKPRHALSSRTASSSAPRPGRLVTDYGLTTVCIVAADGDDTSASLAGALAVAFRQIDARVDLNIPCGRRGRELAQQTG
ncbi:MAG: hypothetical protein NC336_06090, partial [Clostridium sp.]|nr:hypothetical protein [Clostridium sp.]